MPRSMGWKNDMSASCIRIDGTGKLRRLHHHIIARPFPRAVEVVPSVGIGSHFDLHQDDIRLLP